MKKLHFTRYILLFIFILLHNEVVKAQDDGIKNLRQTSKAFASVAKTVSPSVVFIQVERSTPAPYFSPFPFDDREFFGKDLFERFFGERFPGYSGPNKSHPQRKSLSQASGFVFASKDSFFTDKSYIFTNNHVVQNAEKITVILQDKREFTAKIVGTDPQSDVAVIEVSGEKLPTLILGDSSKLEVGEWVVAIGSPFGLSQTLTVGVVSAKGRTSLGINDYEDFIQTDAAINPGNSGGPLLNLNSEVVAMNTAIFSKSGGYMGIGFAIPINLAKSIGEQLIQNGEVTRGHLGVVIQELSQSLAESFNLEESSGVLISQVVEDSPAAKAGLQQGDVIISYDNQPVMSVGGFRNLVASTPPNSQKELTIYRNGKQMKVKVTIDKLPKNEKSTANGEQQTEELGLVIQTITPNIAEKYALKQSNGVLITQVKPGSIAAVSGIEAGTVILQVNRKAINNAAEFNQAIKQSEKEKSVLLLLLKNNIQRFLVLRWS